MTSKKIKLLHILYGGILGLFAVTLGVILIISCLRIYQSGERPFSRESVGAALSPLRIPALFFLALAVGSIFLPKDAASLKKPKGQPDDADALARMMAKIDSYPISIARKVRLEQRLREILCLVNLAVYLIAVTVALVYTLNPDNFPGADANREIMKGALVSVISLAVPLALSVAVSYLNKESRIRESTLLKNALAQKYKSLTDLDEEEVPAKESHLAALQRKLAPVTAFGKRYLVPYLKYAVLLLAVLFIALGIANGGANDVVQKAIKICTECIGLG